MLKKGGGGGKGELLADGNTLADCGLTTSMSIYEHLWVDSAANQAAFWAEYEKMASYVKTQVSGLLPRPRRFASRAPLAHSLALLSARLPERGVQVSPRTHRM